MAWLGRKKLDFYLPDYKIAIECQGRQHFEPVKAFGGEEEYSKIVIRDNDKYLKCKKYGIKLLYLTKTVYMNHYSENEVFDNINELIKQIKESDISFTKTEEEVTVE